MALGMRLGEFDADTSGTVLENLHPKAIRSIASWASRHVFGQDPRPSSTQVVCDSHVARSTTRILAEEVLLLIVKRGFHPVLSIE